MSTGIQGEPWLYHHTGIHVTGSSGVRQWRLVAQMGKKISLSQNTTAEGTNVEDFAQYIEGSSRKDHLAFAANALLVTDIVAVLPA
jgi:hypothetical protein